jgi:HTH-type transcriptional regulator/antitoxin HigA
LSPAQLAWLFRAKHLAAELSVPSYSDAKLRAAIESLRPLLRGPEETKHVPSVLSRAGVRYVIVEGLPSNKIDGVCFWLNSTSPVIAMTLRHDRIDNFWFVLRHEVEHVLRGDGKGKELVDIEPDSELDGAVSYVAKGEQIANQAAANFCVARDRLDDFVARVGPYYAKAKIDVFAEAIGVHPGLVVGQLHKRGVLSYKNLRKFLVHVRGFITETALTDGWGVVPPVGGRS